MIKTITDDLNLIRIKDSGQTFRWENAEDGAVRILMKDRSLYIKDMGDDRFDFDCNEDEFEKIWKDYLDLDESYQSIRKRIDKTRDPFLYRAAESEKGIRILKQDPWEMLISFIISQNKNIPAIIRSINLLCEKAGEKKTDERGKIYYGFPGPKALSQLSEKDLTACSLGYRVKYIMSVTKCVIDGEFEPESLINAGEEETIKTLTLLHGVGNKVANCISLFGLHHLNAFPRDVWVNRILENEYKNGYPYDEYSPYNGVYQQYMFAYYRKANDMKSGE